MIYSTSKELLSEIRHVMYLKDITMKELAHRLNVSQQTVSAIFKKSNPYISTVIEICNALDINMDIKFIDNDSINKNSDTPN